MVQCHPRNISLSNYFRTKVVPTSHIATCLLDSYLHTAKVIDQLYGKKLISVRPLMLVKAAMVKVKLNIYQHNHNYIKQTINSLPIATSV